MARMALCLHQDIHTMVRRIDHVLFNGRRNCRVDDELVSSIFRSITSHHEDRKWNELEMLKGVKYQTNWNFAFEKCVVLGLWEKEKGGKPTVKDVRNRPCKLLSPWNYNQRWSGSQNWFSQQNGMITSTDCRVTEHGNWYITIWKICKESGMKLIKKGYEKINSQWWREGQNVTMQQPPRGECPPPA